MTTTVLWLAISRAAVIKSGFTKRISPKLSPPHRGRGFTLLDRTSVGLQGPLKNLSNRVKGRGDQCGPNIYCPTPPSPIERVCRNEGNAMLVILNEVKNPIESIT